MVSVVSIKEKELRDLYREFGDQRHPLCTECRVKSLARQAGTCAISYAPKAWFTDGRRCPRLAKQERELPFKKLRRGTEGKF